MERLSPKKEISRDILPNIAIAVPQKNFFAKHHKKVDKMINFILMVVKSGQFDPKCGLKWLT